MQPLKTKSRASLSPKGALLNEKGAHNVTPKIRQSPVLFLALKKELASCQQRRGLAVNRSGLAVGRSGLAVFSRSLRAPVG